MAESTGPAMNETDMVRIQRVDNTAAMVERQAATAALSIQQQFDSVMKLLDQRIVSNSDASVARSVALRDYCNSNFEITRARVKTLGKLVVTHLEALEKARVLQAVEYERRLQALNHEHARLDVQSKTYVRSDIYEIAMDRLYKEKIAQQEQTDANRQAAENTAVTNRKNTMLTMVTAVASLVGVLLTVAVTLIFHFGG